MLIIPYNMVGEVLFPQLALSPRFAWLVVVTSQLEFAALGITDFTASDAVFILTVLSGAVISVESFCKPSLALPRCGALAPAWEGGSTVGTVEGGDSHGISLI